MDASDSRRKMLSLTAAGLIHVAAKPAFGEEPIKTDWLVREAAQRGHTDLGWLKSYHSFSFGDYFDQRHMGFRSLRVINDDKIAPGRGFPTHPHRDMEIISYVLSGALQHKDSTGKGAVITAEDIQMMSAGTGIRHSEYNPSSSESNHFLQIWIEPALRGVQPRYSDRKVSLEDRTNQWAMIAGPDHSNAAVQVYQDAKIFAARLNKQKELQFALEKGRHAWIQVATGEVSLNGTVLQAGDAIAASMATDFHILANQDSDILLFDLA